MKRTVRVALLTVSMLVSLVFLFGAVGVPEFGPRGGRGDGAGVPARFHGTPRMVAQPDSLCQSDNCHPSAPHEKEGTLAAFLNFHAEHADCRACHGKNAGAGWIGKKSSDGKWVLGSGESAVSGDPHEMLAPAVSCRGCHSETGIAALKLRGVVGFARGFENPTALRMIEERRNRWLPAGMR